MRRLAAAALAFAWACAVLPSAARADAFSPVSVGVHLSTIGDGITLEKPFLYDFSLRVETNWLSTSQQTTYTNTGFTTTSRFRNVAVLGDFRPYGGRWRISGGLTFGSDEVDNVARLGAPTAQVGNDVYPVSGIGNLTSRVSFSRPGVYLGVGTGTGLIRGLALTVDGGLLLRNGFATANATGPLAADPAFRADLSVLSGQLRTRVITPVASVGLVYRP
ncbi:MAG TPA: hypothetical protein VMD91_03290 [Candidatus Sulfotelmatobacter sp.]|nr:hypothetical protein [Candidatus Sulfotelmatobacter sp.]